MTRLGVWLVIVLLLVPSVMSMAVGDRATSPLTLQGSVLTGDGASWVRGATVSLEIYSDLEVLLHWDLTVSTGAGAYSFTVPAIKWDPGWRAQFRATYALVGALTDANITLTAATTQRVDLKLPWNRTLGMTVTVPEPHRTTERDGLTSWAINVTNGGNDRDSVLLWANASNSSIQMVFNPGNSTELAPGITKLIALVASNPGLDPGTYDIELGWRSQWYTGEGGSVDLTWTVLPEVKLALPKAGIHWSPDPLLNDDDALLNCTVLNGGRDTAYLANVTIELTHPVDGQVLRDRVRIDIPAQGSAIASFPWKAVYSEDPYQLRFMVEHPSNGGVGPDEAEVPLFVGVENVPPTTDFISPANGTHVNSTVLVRLRVTDPDTPVEQVRLSIGGGPWIDLPVTEEPTYAWDTTAVPDGWYTLEAYASDAFADGPVTSVRVKVENGEPNTPPEVFIESPQEGDNVDVVLKAAGIAFDADDNVELVRLRIDGGEWMLAEGSSRWSANISTEGMDPGAHLLEVQADDGIDVSTIESVQFYVTDLPPLYLDMSLVVDPATVLPNENIEVRGELVYGNGVRAEGLQVRIEGPNGLLVFKESDARGVFRLSTVAPNSEGTYSYSATTTDDNDLTASNTTQLRVLKSLEPDLAVIAIRIESEKVAVGINVTVAVDLRNLGFTAGNGTFKAWEGEPGTGEPIEDRPVTVYDRITVSFTWVPTEEGVIDLTVEVVDVRPSDANLSNNRMVEPVIVSNLPDLTIDNISLSNPTPYANTTFTVSVRVENLGGLNASCTVRLYVDGREVENLEGSSDIGVAAYGFAYTGFDIMVDQGPHFVFVDIINAYPEESRTDNNNATLKFNAKGPYVPPTDDGGEVLLGGLTPLTFILILVGAAVITAVAIVLLRYW